jgi:hypothetical protein
VTLSAPTTVERYHPPAMFRDERPEWSAPTRPSGPPNPPPTEGDVPPDWAPPGGSYHNVHWVPNWVPSSHI